MNKIFKMVLHLILIFFCVTFLLPDNLIAKQASDDSFTYLLELSFDELQEIPIESSGLFAMEWSKAPGITYGITKEQFDRFGFRTLAEYIDRMVPGMSYAVHGTQGITLGTRGMLIDNTSKTLLLRDNINLNNRKFVGINGSELSTPLLGDIVRAEVSLSPGALQHGSGAINGFINLISATGESKQGMHLNTSYGSGDSRVIEGSYGKVINSKFNLFFYAGYSKSNGVDPFYTLPKEKWASLNGVTGTPSDTFLSNVRVGKTDDDYKFSFRAQYDSPDDFLSIDFKALLSHTSNVDPVLGEYLSNTASWTDEVRLAAEARGGRYSPFFEQHSDNFLLSPEINLNLSNVSSVRIIPVFHTIKTTSVFSDFLKSEVERLGITLKPTGTPDCPALGCEDEFESYGDERHIGASVIHNYSGFANQIIGWGIDVKNYTFHANPWEWTTASAFAEDQLTLDKWTILAGLRFDKTYFDETIPSIPPYNTGPYQAPDDVDSLTKRLAISYLIDQNQTAKFSYQEGFRFADAWFQQWTAHINKANNTDNRMLPEDSKTFEANYTNNRFLKDKGQLMATIYYNIYENTQAWIPAAANFGNSHEKIQSAGGELSIEISPLEKLDLGLSYSYARPISSYENFIKVANDDNTWTRFPVHMFKTHMTYALTDQILLGGTGNIESPRYEKAMTTDSMVADLFSDWSLHADLFLSYSPSPKLKISFLAKELIRKNFNQYPAYFQGSRPLDSPRPLDPQFFLTISYSL